MRWNDKKMYHARFKKSHYEAGEYFTKKMTPFHSFDDVITPV